MSAAWARRRRAWTMWCRATGRSITRRRSRQHRRLRPRRRKRRPTTRLSAMPGIDESRTFVPVRIAIMTVSDTRTLADDKSGDTLAARIADAGHVLADRVIVTDDQPRIVAHLNR